MLEKTPKDDLEAREAKAERAPVIPVEQTPALQVEAQSEILQPGSSRRSGSFLRAALLTVRGIVQLVLMVLVLAVAVYVMRGLIASAPEPRSRPVFQTVFTVEATDVELRDNQPVFSVFGTVTAARDVELRALSPGEITSVNPRLQAGKRVEAGEVLVEIDTFEYEGALAEARANLAEAVARLAEKQARISGAEAQIEGTRQQLQLAKDDLARAEDLVSRGTLPARDLENRRVQVNERELALTQRLSNLEVEQAGVAQLEAQGERLQWRVTQAERALQNTRLTAPFAGIVRSASAEVGRNASAADVLISLYDDGDLEARFTLSDGQFGRLVSSESGLVGRPVQALWNVGGQDYVFEGEIARTGAQIASERGGVEVFARLDAGTGAVTLRPGAFVAVEVPDRVFAQTARLPETALYDGDHVYAIVEGALERRDVEVLAYDGDDAVVRGAFADGERVLNTRLAQISEGTKVRTADEPIAEQGARVGNRPNSGDGARGEGRPSSGGDRRGSESRQGGGQREGGGNRPSGD
ncbi:MAG: HlyD family efflux transporter periplasmic adaptor subunit [Pseudomonadota bacterium]